MLEGGGVGAAEIKKWPERESTISERNTKSSVGFIMSEALLFSAFLIWLDDYLIGYGLVRGRERKREDWKILEREKHGKSSFMFDNRD